IIGLKKRGRPRKHGEWKDVKFFHFLDKLTIETLEKIVSTVKNCSKPCCNIKRLRNTKNPSCDYTNRVRYYINISSILRGGNTYLNLWVVIPRAGGGGEVASASKFLEIAYFETSIGIPTKCYHCNKESLKGQFTKMRSWARIAYLSSLRPGSILDANL